MDLMARRRVMRASYRPIIYGFHIDSTVSDPSNAVTYLEDAVGMTPAKMDYAHDVFDYGSWENAFFMPRPCMLKYDGTVDYYLDPDDYTKKIDGTPSDVGDANYDGNAMVEWGRDGNKIWYKIVPDSDPESASVYIANTKIDNGYVAWPFVNFEGDLVNHFYTAIYNGSLDSSGRLRSLSGVNYSNFCKNKLLTGSVTCAKKNNPTGSNLWYIDTWADVVLIRLLHILVGKSLSGQTVFGNGRCGQINVNSAISSGTMDAKGLFWGAQADENGKCDFGVKTFGMCNFWGNMARDVQGLIGSSGIYKYKMTSGPQDGSTSGSYDDGYNGYINSGVTMPTVPSGTLPNITTQRFIGNCMLPYTTNSVNSKDYYCSAILTNKNQGPYRLRIGMAASNTPEANGIMSMAVSANTYSATYTWVGANLSCKPQKQK